MTLLDLSAAPPLGLVVRVAAGGTTVRFSEPRFAARVSVNDVVATPGRTAGEWLIALVEGASRDELVIAIVGSLRDGRFVRGAHTFPTVGSACHSVEGQLLARFMAILGDSVAAGERLELGSFVAERDAPAIADGNKLFQRHAALLGSTGAGKSWTVALMVERAAQLAHSNVVVFDMHGEYTPLTQPSADGPPLARGLRIAGPGDVPGEDVVFVPYWLLDRDEMLSLVLDESDPDAATQALRFTDHVFKLKRGTLFEIGHEEIATTFTVDSPIPYRLETLVAWLRTDDTEKIVRQPSGNVEPGPYYDRLTRFIARLEARIADGRYGFMFQPPAECLEYGWIEQLVATLLDASGAEPGIKVIDFSEVPAEALPVVVGVIARLLYDVQFWMDPDERTPVSFVCDEAHLYLPVGEESQPVHRVALRAFEQIAKEGRKYGVGLVVVSQRPADISRTVLAQCNNFIVMRLTNDRDQQVIKQLVPESLARVTDVLPLLEVGEAVVLGDALLLPTPVRFQPPVVKPASATRAFWNDWARRPTSDAAISAGLESWRRQSRLAPATR